MATPKLDSRTARAKLKQKREPYWIKIDRGLQLGYRRGANGGTWVARRWNSATEKYEYSRLGLADDDQKADGKTVLDYTQARKRADNEDPSHDIDKSAYTVANAAEDYLRWYKLNRKAHERTEQTCNAHILPKLGSLKVGQLKTRQINKWLHELAEAPPKASGGKPKPPYAKKINTGKRTKSNYNPIYKYEPLPYSDWTEEMRRKRKSTANRILTVLKAALNHAWKNGHATHREEWQKVEPFKEVDAPKVAYLTEKQAGKLLKAASDDFRPMAKAALLTGCRYGELTRLKASDLMDGQLFIEKTKSGKPRHVPLSHGGIVFFKALAEDRQPNDLMLTHLDGSSWDRSHQTRPMRQACEKAGIDPVGFHVLRHTYATLLLRTDGSQGVSIRYVAALIGDSVATCEKHYGHVIQDDLQKEVARKLPSFGGAS